MLLLNYFVSIGLAQLFGRIQLHTSLAHSNPTRQILTRPLLAPHCLHILDDNMWMVRRSAAAGGRMPGPGKTIIILLELEFGDGPRYSLLLTYCRPPLLSSQDRSLVTGYLS